jgi:hypothetical protein
VGKTVEVPPGRYAFAPSGMPPFAPVVITPTAPPGVTGAIASTEVSDVPQPESPGQVAAAVGGVPPPPAVGPGPILPSPTLPPVPRGVIPPSVLSGAGAPAVPLSAPGALTVPGVLGGVMGVINDPRQAECPSCAQ